MGLGEQEKKYEIPKATICFQEYCMNLQFFVGNIPIECILGNVFLADVEPHGYARLKYGKARYFIFVPNQNGFL